jgi:hypothetical protein
MANPHTLLQEESMLTKEGLEFLLKLTDYFKGHWEDPGWGQKPINQVLILLSAHTLADGIAETGAQRQVQAAIEKAMTDAAQRAIKGDKNG